MAPDPRWLEILKASGWQTTAIAVACGLFLLADQRAWLPPLDSWMIQLAAFGLVLSGSLALASFCNSVLRLFPIHVLLTNVLRLRRKQRDAENYIPHMTLQERAIVAYLLEKNQKMFTCDADGEYAATLISRGIVVRALQPGQPIDMTRVPMTIPDHIWSILLKHKSSFPYTPPRQGESETHPWHIPWMAR